MLGWQEELNGVAMLHCRNLYHKLSMVSTLQQSLSPSVLCYAMFSYVVLAVCALFCIAVLPNDMFMLVYI